MSNWAINEDGMITQSAGDASDSSMPIFRIAAAAHNDAEVSKKWQDKNQ